MQPIEGKILILDDDPGFTRLLTDILQEEGYKVAALNSAKDVLYLARQFLPDLLVLDIMMPEMEGYAVCEFFKRDPELKFTRVIVLTGKDTVDCRVRSYKAGTDAFMTKPVELEEFREVVRTHLAAKLALDQMVGSLKDQGIYDLVTNCYTWRYVERRLTEELKRLERHKRVLSVLLVQLDHFSNIPLRYGFNFGNEILKTVSEAIAKKIREFGFSRAVRRRLVFHFASGNAESRSEGCRYSHSGIDLLAYFHPQKTSRGSSQPCQVRNCRNQQCG